jgi:hypothetical protein
MQVSAWLSSAPTEADAARRLLLFRALKASTRLSDNPGIRGDAPGVALPTRRRHRPLPPEPPDRVIDSVRRHPRRPEHSMPLGSSNPAAPPSVGDPSKSCGGVELDMSYGGEEVEALSDRDRA